MKKAAAVLLVMAPIALVIFFNYFQETLPGGFSYEESSATLTIYESYQSEMRSYPLDTEDTSVALSAAVLRNEIDRQLSVLFVLAGLLQALFVLQAAKKTMFSRYYWEMNGKVLYWFGLAVLIGTMAFLVYMFMSYTDGIHTWIEHTDTSMEEADRE